ncbi:MAG: HlyD family type I secretion periplasmic adaptor subunit [Desulfovibrio sp.]|nr:HlyD family type I secretion periplasmic adaptor subunit [Desulfovibrio sp.]
MREQLEKALAVLDSKIIRPIVGVAEKRQAAYGENVEDPRRIIRQGLFVVFLFFGVFGVWSVVGHISGAVVAQGKIKVETERKTVQHLEGGIVDSILVREGEDVKAGQPLILLESVQVDANASMLQKQLVAQLAAQYRAAIEKDLGATLQWPEKLVRMAELTHSLDVLENEKKIFVARQDSLNGQISLLKAQLAQLDAQVAGFEDQVKAEKVIIGTLNEELHAKRQLFKERYLEKSQILELERNQASHQGNLGRLKQSIAEARQRIAELNLRIEDAKIRFVEDATSTLGRLENEILQTRERIRPLKDARERLQIVAPVSGKVVDLKVHSKGGVVRPGEPLMDIVPHDNPLVVETHVPVNKITDVYIGQEAQVQLDAFDIRIAPHMPGKVTYISADRLEEHTPAGDLPYYYLCYVELDPKALQEAELYVSPGMPATVFITTKETTVLYYILEPLLKNWDRALRE